MPTNYTNMWRYEKQFRKENPQTIGETDAIFDLNNYKDWLEERLENYLEVFQDIFDDVEAFSDISSYGYGNKIENIIKNQ